MRLIDLFHSRLIKIVIFCSLFVCFCITAHADCLMTLKKHTKASSAQPASTSQDKLEEYDEEWVEDFHERVSEGVYQSALWFDNFFTEEDCQQKNPSANARIKLEWAPKARDWQEFKVRFRLKVKLPHFSNKMDLILSDNDENTNNQLPLESINSRPQTEEEHFAAAVRYVYIKDSRQLTDTRLGISGGDIFLRTRYVRRFTWQENHSVKVEPSAYYFLDDGWGSKLLLEYDYQLSKQAQFRINYSTRGSQAYSGIKWKHGMYKLNQIDSTTASLFGLQVEGVRNSDRGFVIDKYTLSYRYRFNAYKKWLFFEVEPFMEWPEERNYKTTPGIALRIEGYFYKH